MAPTIPDTEFRDSLPNGGFQRAKGFIMALEAGKYAYTNRRLIEDPAAPPR